MTPVLIVHIAAGVAAIASGTTALAVRKGGRLHRLAGTVFVLSMTTMAALAIYLALFVPPVGAGGAPPGRLGVGGHADALSRDDGVDDSAARTRTNRIVRESGVFRRGGRVRGARDFRVSGRRLRWPCRALFRLRRFRRVHGSPGPQGHPARRHFGVARLSRHLWRMCSALFFACAFFFIGQQKVMPKALHGSPVLIALGWRRWSF